MSDLPQIQECLLDILKALPERPRRLRLGVGEVAIELDWPDSEQAIRGALAPPAAGHVAAGGDAAAAEPGQAPASGNQIQSPSVGTFYRSPEPGSAPFVAEGDLVRPGQQVAIVEAMKLMLPVEASEAGRIVKILKDNGEPVEYGEPLMEVGPADGREEGD